MANQQTYSFNSVGETVEEYRQTNRIDSPIGGLTPIGIKTPVQLGEDTDGLLVMNYRVADSIKDNLRNLLLTNHGERIGQFDFGANLQELTFELGTPTFDTEAMIRITTAVEKFMPYVKLKDFKPLNEPSAGGGLSKAGFSLTYSVPMAKIAHAGIDLILYSAG